ncbi:hypothetical protein WDU94_000315 [Cyamophila willieti]
MTKTTSMERTVSFITVLLLASSILFHGVTGLHQQEGDMFRIDDKTIISKKQTVSKLSDRVRSIIEHYQQEDPVGLPDTRIPDPLPVPDLQKGGMSFDHMQVYGLSQFRIVKVHADVPAMEITMGFLITKLEILGNYTLRQFWSSSHGPFNVTLLNVYIEGKGALIVNRVGKLEAERVDMNARVENIKLDFENLGVLGAMVQGLLNTAGPFLFDSVKPQLLTEFNVKLLVSMNENLKAMNVTFEPSGGLPVDNLIRTVRNMIRERHIDPYQVEIAPGLLNNSVLQIEQFVLHGLSTFYRIGDISLHVENKTLQFSLHIGIPQLKGRLAWALTYVTRSQTCFTLKYVQIQISINQTINDLGRSPQLNNIDVQIGNVKLTKHYAKQSLMRDLIQRYVYNVLPNVLRLQILYLMKQPLHYVIQNTLDQIKLKDYLTQI